MSKLKNEKRTFRVSAPITIKLNEPCTVMTCIMVCSYQTDSWISCLTIRRDLTA